MAPSSKDQVLVALVTGACMGSLALPVFHEPRLLSFNWGGVLLVPVRLLWSWAGASFLTVLAATLTLAMLELSSPSAERAWLPRAQAVLAALGVAILLIETTRRLLYSQVGWGADLEDLDVPWCWLRWELLLPLALASALLIVSLRASAHREPR